LDRQRCNAVLQYICPHTIQFEGRGTTILDFDTTYTAGHSLLERPSCEYLAHLRLKTVEYERPFHLRKNPQGPRLTSCPHHRWLGWANNKRVIVFLAFSIPLRVFKPPFCGARNRKFNLSPPSLRRIWRLLGPRKAAKALFSAKERFQFRNIAQPVCFAYG
jgi:hypothetical protein